MSIMTLRTTRFSITITKCDTQHLKACAESHNKVYECRVPSCCKSWCHQLVTKTSNLFRIAVTALIYLVGNKL
jgi:hypothetical protein